MSTADIPPELTRDAIWNGRLSLVQPRDGYRFSIDALLLADFVRLEEGWTVVDLGTGVGVIALAVAQRLGQGRVIAVEVQTRLIECARINVQANPGRVDVCVLEMDWADLSAETIGGPVKLVVANPPYRRPGTGRINPHDEEALARHEIRGSLASAALAASRIMGLGGRLAVVYPASRLPGLIIDLTTAGFEPKRMRLVHSRPGGKARLVLMEAVQGGGQELEVGPPLYLYESPGVYTDEAQAILNGPFRKDSS